LMIDFVNLKIKLSQSFGCAHENRVCVHIFREVSAPDFVKQGARNMVFYQICF
jgi:hypothetical protein